MDAIICSIQLSMGVYSRDLATIQNQTSQIMISSVDLRNKKSSMEDDPRVVI